MLYSYLKLKYFVVIDCFKISFSAMTSQKYHTDHTHLEKILTGNLSPVIGIYVFWYFLPCQTFWYIIILIIKLI
jgi:hypothetical protein